MHLADFARGMNEADAANEDGKFVCLYGMEYGLLGKTLGHVLIYGYPKLIGWDAGNFGTFSPRNNYAAVFGLLALDPNAVVTLAHPGNADFNDLLDQPYNPMFDRVIDGVAVASGPHKAPATNYPDRQELQFYSYYRKLLALGYHVGPTIDEDNHLTTFGRMSASRTVVLATSLTRQAIMDAYRHQRFYASTDWNAQVTFTIDGKVMGSRVAAGKECRVVANVSDTDRGDNVAIIKLYRGTLGLPAPPTVIFSSEGVPVLEIMQTLSPKTTYYFYLDITQQDGDRIITAPIWVTGSSKKDSIENNNQVNGNSTGTTSPVLTAFRHQYWFNTAQLFLAKSTRYSCHFLWFKFETAAAPLFIGLLFVFTMFYFALVSLAFNRYPETFLPFGWTALVLPWWGALIGGAYVTMMLIGQPIGDSMANANLLISLSVLTMVIHHRILAKYMRSDRPINRTVKAVLHWQYPFVNFIFWIVDGLKTIAHFHALGQFHLNNLVGISRLQLAILAGSAILFLIARFFDSPDDRDLVMGNYVSPVDLWDVISPQRTLNA